MNPCLYLAIGVVADIHADEAPGNTGPDFGKAGPFGLLVVVLLLLAVIFLVWSMNRHLRKLPESFDRENPTPDQAVDEGTLEVDEAFDEAPDAGLDKDWKTGGGHNARRKGAPADRNGSRHEPES